MISEIIKDAASEFPDKPAFRSENEAITYEELVKYSNQLAFALKELGVKRGDRVGIFLEPCLETAVSVYGIVSAGAVFVPLDPNAPPKRIAYVVNDCGIRHIISRPKQSRSLSKVLEEEIQIESVIGVDQTIGTKNVSWDEVRAISPDKSNSVRILEDDLAYIMYTSGTTGTPKGIMHTHRSGLAYAKLSKALYDVRQTDILGNHSPLHFDISTMGYLTMPLAGGTTVLIPESHKKFPASLSRLIETEKLTIWYSVPLALIHLLQRGALEQRNLDSLRWVLFGGEPFAAKHLRSLMSILNKATFSNVYGPAEVNQCTYFNFAELPPTDEAVPLGSVWNNTEVLIVDENDEEVATGEIGELLVRTATMMKGYWGKPDLTRKSTFRRERLPNVEEVFYRTGDLVFENKDGQLMFAGRKDRQIKVRGYRIELTEIESVLMSNPNIIETAVYSLKRGEESEIEAIVVLKEQGQETRESIREFLSEHIPGYAMPENICLNETIPRTSAGKIDYKLLIKERAEEFRTT